MAGIAVAAIIADKIHLFFAINNKNESLIAWSFLVRLIIVPCLIVDGIASTISYWPT